MLLVLWSAFPQVNFGTSQLKELALTLTSFTTEFRSQTSCRTWFFSSCPCMSCGPYRSPSLRKHFFAACFLLVACKCHSNIFNCLQTVLTPIWQNFGLLRFSTPGDDSTSWPWSRYHLCVLLLMSYLSWILLANKDLRQPSSCCRMDLYWSSSGNHGRMSPQSPPSV